jgi:hypothetical protein
MRTALLVVTFVALLGALCGRVLTERVSGAIAHSPFGQIAESLK